MVIATPVSRSPFKDSESDSDASKIDPTKAFQLIEKGLNKLATNGVQLGTGHAFEHC